MTPNLPTTTEAAKSSAAGAIGGAAAAAGNVPAHVADLVRSVVPDAVAEAIPFLMAAMPPGGVL